MTKATAQSIEKLIVTNRGALRRKYGERGLGRIDRALSRLIVADRLRGIDDAVVAIDDPAEMRRWGAKAVASRGSGRDAKRAIDAVWHKLEAPEYLLILGGPDIVPHVILDNPVPHGPDEDDDRNIDSDLPYACDVSYSRDVHRFIAPSRVVGRLPDQPGANDPGFLISLLDFAAAWRSSTARRYRKHFALSTHSWRRSTTKTLKLIFGAIGPLHVSPPAGPDFRRHVLSALIHFVNCHGDHRNAVFWGEQGEELRRALEGGRLPGTLKSGSVLVSECCYGAEVAVTPGTRRLNIALTYLKEGAYGVFGSTTVAYGGKIAPSHADVICRYFMRALLRGASLGRATLEARQKFIRDAKDLDAFEAKTIAQFLLLGDPSIHAVRAARARANGSSRRIVVTGTPPRAERNERRRRLVAQARTLATESRVARSDRKIKPTETARRRLRDRANKLVGAAANITSYRARHVSGSARRNGGSNNKTTRLEPRGEVRFHVLLTRAARGGPVSRMGALVARERGGKVVIERIESK